LIDYEREVFSECGAWKNFHDLEESVTLDELMCLYESAMIRQMRAVKTVAAAMGSAGDDEPEPSYSQRLKDRNSGEKNKPSKKYLKPWMVDPSVGGEVTPSFGENEVTSLPINLGYSIISDEE
jgi:hypothetical protein